MVLIHLFLVMIISTNEGVRVVCCSSLPSKPLPVFHRTLLAALSACSPNLLHLEIHIDLDLSPFRFPFLQTLSVSRNVHFTTEMFLFLQHHSTVETLELKSTTVDNCTAAPIHLPRLLRFAGTNLIMDNLIPGSSIRDIYIRWTADVSTAGIENMLRAFISSADSVRTFRSADTKSYALFLNTLSHT